MRESIQLSKIRSEDAWFVQKYRGWSIKILRVASKSKVLRGRAIASCNGHRVIMRRVPEKPGQQGVHHMIQKGSS